MKLKDKTIIVTAAGRGIGKGCAVELANQGASLIVNDRPGSQDLQATVEELRDQGANVHGVEADVFTRSGCEGLLREAEEQSGPVYGLVSCPAFQKVSPFLDLQPEDFENVVQGTLFSSFHMSQLVARQMVDEGIAGKIVFISSVLAQRPMAQKSAYCAAKAGLNQLAMTIAVELACHRINVNVIEPGWIDTPGEREAFTPKFFEREATKLPWGKLGTARDIGRAATFLMSPDADYITGAILPVDGAFRYRDGRMLD
ncbi:3-oxoacyl-[acyl-carrier-protein] reductase FabG1 [Rosistilla ulvae]|uniref:3-oxoacyl-[acyl-carrier-protein] reductase FabG1 n=1 Tax=Rosistilla ulvae TaxID=1930277 RepID=A0A517M4M9_9BACT|nr:SDR family oxidoreductase [Rosistilla ulvae]QDS89827.1 3-oxoacyl-[acyl-carrier-protein] reductase FabG1 [Rosistilla ulvae]